MTCKELVLQIYGGWLFLYSQINDDRLVEGETD